MTGKSAISEHDKPHDTVDDSEMSRILANAGFNAAAVIGTFSEREFGNFDLDILMDTLEGAHRRIAAGDPSDMEAMLLAQAQALQSIFTTLAIRACQLLGNYREFDVFLRLALKSQSQCRNTLQTLVSMKNPRQVAFVSQANIAHGPQQINNISTRAADTSPSHPKDAKQTIQEVT